MDCFETLETVPRLFRTLFGAGRGRLFGDSFGIPGPKDPGDSCKGRAGLQDMTSTTTPLQALSCALCATEQSMFRGRDKGEKAPRKGEEEGWPAKGAKRKKGRMKTGQ